MNDLVFHVPTKVYFGLDIINRLASIVSGYGSRALIITEGILYDGDVISRVQSVLEKKNIDSIVFDEMVPNATSVNVEDAITLARGSHAQVVIGLGGVRTLSAARCVAMAVGDFSTIDDYLDGLIPDVDPLPFIGIPTTCRDPFLFRNEYLITDGRDRTSRILKTPEGINSSVIIDPRLSLTLPPKYTATTMMDTFIHAVEGYLSSTSTFITDTLYLRALELLSKSLLESVSEPDNVRLRVTASQAGLVTALGLSMNAAGVATALSYAINSHFMIPKSWVSTIMIPHVLEYFTTSASEKIARIGNILGEDMTGLSAPEAANVTVEAVRKLIGELGIPMRLRDFNTKLEDLVNVLDDARSFDLMNHTVRTISAEDLYDLVKQAY
ncbi:MAG: iron-containing alcohol dehydrogenase [Spirochaetia bacterium]